MEKTLGEELRILRMQYPMTQEELSQGICHRTTMQKYESNKRRPRPKNLMKILKALKQEYQYRNLIRSFYRK